MTLICTPFILELGRPVCLTTSAAAENCHLAAAIPAKQAIPVVNNCLRLFIFLILIESGALSFLCQIILLTTQHWSRAC